MLFVLSNCANSWKATLQLMISLSTPEAVYMGVACAMKEAIWETRLDND